MARSRYIVMSKKYLKGLEVVSSLQHWAKNMFEMLLYNKLVFDQILFR